LVPTLWQNEHHFSTTVHPRDASPLEVAKLAQAATNPAIAAAAKPRNMRQDLRPVELGHCARTDTAEPLKP